LLFNKLYFDKMEKNTDNPYSAGSTKSFSGAGANLEKEEAKPISIKENPLNTKLVQDLRRNGNINSSEVESCMKSIDRGDFTSMSPYIDCPQSIGYGATISAPHMHAAALEYLKDHLKYAKKSLDIGSGTGYLTLAFAKLMNEPGAISYGIDHIPELVQLAMKNISKSYADYLTKGKILLVEGDGRLGLKKYGPYDVIHVGAAAETLPTCLIEQLANGGRMCIPVGKGSQDFLVVDKDKDGKVSQKTAFGVRYIPLTSKEAQIGNRY